VGGSECAFNSKNGVRLRARWLEALEEGKAAAA
jgi:hypothetical protein